MKIVLMSEYDEIGTSFRLSHLVLKALRDELRNILAPIQIKEFQDRFQGQEFSVGFVISATRESDRLRVKGPIFMKKPKGVDFVFVIPYREIPEVQERIDYVFDHLASGILEVLSKYNVPDPGVAQAVKDVAKMVHDNPKEFEYTPKHVRQLL